MAMPIAAPVQPRPRGPDRQALRAALSRTSGAMLRAYLRYYNRSSGKDLTIGTNDTGNQIVDRILDYVDSREIGVDTMARAIVDFADYGSKSVHLFTLGAHDRKSLAGLSLPRRVPSLADAAILTGQATPRISYSYMDARTLRVSFSETQKRAFLSARTYRPVEEEVDRVVALVADRATGRVSLQFDSEVGKNVSRERSGSDYYEYYRSEAAALLGVQLREMDLQRRLQALEVLQSQAGASPSAGALVRMPMGRFRTGDGQVQLVSDDYRLMAVHSRVRPNLIAKTYGQYVWLKEADLGAEHAEELRGHGLLREVYTRIDAYPARVQFMADVLREEVEYVLRRLT